MLIRGDFSPKTQQTPMYQHLTNFKNTAIFGHYLGVVTKRGYFFVKIMTLIFTKQENKELHFC